MTTRRWIDWVNVILGVWLIASPWHLTPDAADGPAAWSSWIFGAGIVTLALFAMYKPAVWVDTVGVMFGVSLVASPWMLAFRTAPPAATNAVIIGLLVIGYALWALRIDVTSGEGPTDHTSRGWPG